MRSKLKKGIMAVLWNSVASLIAVMTVYPLLWMIATSLKAEAEIYQSSLSLIVKSVTWEHYQNVFARIPFLRYFINSLILSSGGVATNLLFGSLAGYTFARLKFRGSKILFNIFLASLMVPSVITMIPLFQVLKFFPLVGGNDIFGKGGTGFINTYWAILLPGAAGAFAIFFM